MRRREALGFWTALGRELLGEPASVRVPLPVPLPPLPRHPEPAIGTPDTGTRSRHVGPKAWSILRDAGFSKGLSLEPWPGVDLFLPFRRGSLAAVPQGFSQRIPGLERAYALVGKSAACSLCGFRLVLVLSRWDEEVLGVLSRGNALVVTLDRLQAWLASYSSP